MAKRDLSIEPPLMNAAGILGFSPDRQAPLDRSGLGAFVTNPVSLAPRTPARGKRFAAYPGGFLLHTGYPNPGLSHVLRHYARQWRRSTVPIIVHLLARGAEELATMVRRLEVVDGVMGLEIGVDSDASPEQVLELAQAAAGELPLIMRLPMEQASALAPFAIDGGADAVSLAPARGTYPMENGEVLQGRLYGPAVLPLALQAVQALAGRGIPVIGAGGVYTQAHREAMLAAGAFAVQLDSVLWRGGGYKPFI